MSESVGVLVIDDDAVMLRAVSETLRRAGYKVTAVADPVEGIETAKDPAIDVVVSDLRMPHLSGIDVLKSLKGERADLAVILMTAHGTMETAIEALRAGAYDLLLFVEGRTLPEVAAFVSERLSPLEGVLSTSTHFMLKTYKRLGVLMHQETSDERLSVSP